MTEKRLFPGVSDAEVSERRREQVAADERARKVADKASKIKEATDAMNAQRQRTKRRQAFLKEKWPYTAPFPNVKSRDKIINRKDIYKALSALLPVVASVTWMIGGIHSEFNSSGHYEYPEGTEPVEHDEYGYAIFNHGTYVKDYQESTFDDVMYGISKVGLCLMILSICALIGARKKLKDVNKNIDEAIDLMLDIKDNKPDFKIDEKQLKKLLKIVPEVVSRMSEAESVYFTMLMDGHLEIVNEPTFRNMAIAIMEGHLQRHPEDMERVLEVFEKDSIPENILSLAQTKKQR